MPRGYAEDQERIMAALAEAAEISKKTGCDCVRYASNNRLRGRQGTESIMLPGLGKLIKVNVRRVWAAIPQRARRSRSPPDRCEVPSGEGRQRLPCSAVIDGQTQSEREWRITVRHSFCCYSRRAWVLVCTESVGRIVCRAAWLLVHFMATAIVRTRVSTCCIGWLLSEILWGPFRCCLRTWACLPPLHERRASGLDLLPRLWGAPG
jgi:hypothetical protein